LVSLTIDSLRTVFDLLVFMVDFLLENVES